MFIVYCVGEDLFVQQHIVFLGADELVNARSILHLIILTLSPLTSSTSPLIPPPLPKLLISLSPPSHLFSVSLLTSLPSHHALLHPTPGHFRYSFFFSTPPSSPSLLCFPLLSSPSSLHLPLLFLSSSLLPPLHPLLSPPFHSHNHL